MWQYTAGTYRLLYIKKKKKPYLPTLFLLDPLPETQNFFFWPYGKDQYLVVVETTDLGDILKQDFYLVFES